MTDTPATTTPADSLGVLDEQDWPEWAGSYLAVRRLDHQGNYLILVPLIGLDEGVTRNRLSLCTADAVGEGWCYSDGDLGWRAFMRWPVVPTHWTRHMPAKAGAPNDYPTDNQRRDWFGR